jgi:hypothetical protein
MMNWSLDEYTSLGRVREEISLLNGQNLNTAYIEAHPSLPLPSVQICGEAKPERSKITDS